ncbi:neuropeptide CCHamide-1 receptor [Nilaparvata lugens]|uniref:Neuropeptide GPCR A15 n=1 Tax=Nilaparvata lugens TaxID=108931 RepID=U3U7M5_NILLU|nr:neuropeptide CCHamide-1 receptor [Nilaparvata lugens]XP_022188987.2 neuropeptide CCHamide-1 receptor [Nilaparvata lugens]XP_022188988.2 neuropeptide CCHamide-1 receptor [Nilaparvata lugens]XP_022188990.2 neuropeptide CCHamide-1 receptor [Nilaparvata lugens]XP_022188991.2 neuropeptide CCHamide-1 receptor [Nilaparvata lugens]XP_039294650.1 neuropeptide CCHamide-1 receptor [Nilaparvata lugens]XP_039294656.1 neuropeptide CCHamide-1 receptor [Nilaparvata lugens]XP_039294678.1 neuropeptide CCHa
MENDTLGLMDNSSYYVSYSQRPETYIVPVIFAVIFFVGVLGNGTLILIFARNRAMRNVPNTYIFSLALGDLLVIVSCVPFTSTLYTVESWPWGEAICKLSEMAKDVSIGVSVFTLTVLSAERYFAIVKPLRRHVSSKPFTIATAIFIWIVSCLLALPAVINSTIQHEIVSKDKVIVYCTPFPEEYGKSYSKFIVMTRFLIYYLIPLCIIGFFYILMARFLVISTQNMPGEQQGQQSNQIKARKKVAKMVLAFVIIFVICFLPIHIFMLWFHFDPEAQEDYDEYWHTLRIIGFCLSYINSCVNPIALYCVSKVFRRYFNQYLFCCLYHPSQQDMSRMNMYSSTYRRHNSISTSHYTISNAERT